MKSAYTLLPSREYFNRVGGTSARPIIEFSASTTLTSSFRTLYGLGISDYDNMRKFILGDNGLRSEPLPQFIHSPNVLKQSFLSIAEDRHLNQDLWQAPEGIKTIEIIGWGLPTIRGVVYKSARCRSDVYGCVDRVVLDPQPLDTVEGDGTVVYASAEALRGEKYYVNVREHNKLGQNNTNRKHKNILEIESLQTLIKTLLRGEATSTLPTYLSIIKPTETIEDQRLKIEVHSPVTLHLYDAFNNHTGRIANTNPSSDLEFYEENIPNSYYLTLGEGQYAGVGSSTVKIQLNGTELGSATLGVEKLVGDTGITSTTFLNVPIASTTIAVINVVENQPYELQMDVDGNGTFEANITPDGLSNEDLLILLKGIVKTLGLSSDKETQLIGAMDKLMIELIKERKNTRIEKVKTEQAFEKLISMIKKYQKTKVLTASEASELIKIIEFIRSKIII
jgi:hypothetical protein